MRREASPPPSSKKDKKCAVGPWIIDAQFDEKKVCDYTNDSVCNSIVLSKRLQQIYISWSYIEFAIIKKRVFKNSH